MEEKSSEKNTRPRPNPVLNIPQGSIEGFVLASREGKDYYGFYGIPYAKPPSRFQAPERWEEWSGVLDGTKAKERCVQASLITRRVFGSEDCLFLNVFTPQLPPTGRSATRMKESGVQSKALLPVMVFIFGGGFYVGGGDLYGGKLLVDHDVVLVTFNYRVGAFGFLNSGDGQVEGNMGLKDQLMCLRWVNENIRHFGGDPEQVTLFGESAGAACVHYHMMSPMSTGLFHKAIMQSGTALSPWALMRKPADKVRDLVTRMGLNCDTDDMTQMIEMLKEVNPLALAAQNMNYEVWKDQDLVYFAPSVESGYGEKFLCEEPHEILSTRGILNQVPLILGVNAREGAYRAIPLLQNPVKLKLANESWNDASSMLILSNKKLLKNHDEFATAMRKFYFGSQPISMDTRERLIDMISDRYFIHPTRVTATQHLELQKNSDDNPIWLYYFDYPGEFSYLNAFGIFETHGATHADELQYLLNQRIFYSKIARGTEDDLIVAKMTEMWANFAKTGQPRHKGEDFSWEPLTPDDKPMRYYRISYVDSMIEEPFKSRMAFWDSLHFEYF